MVRRPIPRRRHRRTLHPPRRRRHRHPPPCRQTRLPEKPRPVARRSTSHAYTIPLSGTGRPLMPAVARVEASGPPLGSPWIGIRPARRSTGTTDRPTCGSEAYDFPDGVARLIRRLFDRFCFVLSRWCGRCPSRASQRDLPRSWDGWSTSRTCPVIYAASDRRGRSVGCEA